MTTADSRGREAAGAGLRRWAVWLLYGLLAAAAVYVLVRNLDHPNDFRHFRDFGLSFLAGQFPYDPAVEARWYDGRWANWPPSFLPLAVLLARVDAAAGQAVAIFLWQAANLAALGFVLAVWIRWLYGRDLSLRPLPGAVDPPGRDLPSAAGDPPGGGTGRSGRAGARLPLWSLAAMAGLLVPARLLLSNFEHSQSNLLIVGLAVAAFVLFRRGRRAAGGMALGLSVALKATSLVLVPYLAWRGRWKDLAASAAGGAVAWGVLPALTVGPGEIGRWYAAWWERTRALELPTTGMNQSLQATLTRLWAPEGVSVPPGPGAGGLGGYGAEVWMIAALAGLGLAAAAAFGRPFRPVSRRREALELGVGFAAMGLLSPLGWKAHFVGLMPLALALYAVLPRAAGWRRAAWDPGDPDGSGGRDLSGASGAGLGTLEGWRARLVGGVLVAAGAAVNLTSTGVVGGAAADLLEAYGVVTWSGAALLLAGLWALAAGRAYPSPSPAASDVSP